MNPTHKQNPSTEDILRIIRDIMTDKKCEEVSILNLESVNSYLSYFVICTVNSAVQANAVAREVRKTLKEYKLSHKETDKTGTSATSGWTLFGFRRNYRSYYDSRKKRIL